MFFTQLMHDILSMTDNREKLRFLNETIANYENLAIVLTREPSTSISLLTVSGELEQLRELRDSLE